MDRVDGSVPSKRESCHDREGLHQTQRNDGRKPATVLSDRREEAAHERHLILNAVEIVRKTGFAYGRLADH
jgi:hypothetical protein